MEQYSVNPNYVKPRFVDLYSPVEIIDVGLSIDPRSGSVRLAPRIMNVSPDTVVAVSLQATCMDSFGDTLDVSGNPFRIVLQDENVVAGGRVAANKSIDLSSLPDTRIIDILVLRVAFADGTYWEKGDYPLVQSYNQSVPEVATLRQLRQVAGEDAQGYAHLHADCWMCICGRQNALGLGSCLRCRRESNIVLASFAGPEQVKDALAELAVVRRMESEKQTAIAAEDAKIQKEKNRKLFKRMLKLSPVFVLLLSTLAFGAITQWTFSYRHYEQGRLNEPDAAGNTALHRAILSGDESLAIRIIGKGAILEAINKEGYTPLIMASALGRSVAVEELLKYNVYLEQEKDGLTAAMHASEAKYPEIAKMLLSKGARSRITIVQTTTRVHIGRPPIQLKASVVPEEALDKGVIWHSSNTSVATVSPDGLVTGVGVGTATISAKLVDDSASASLLVTSTMPVSGIALTPSTVSVAINSTRTLSATISPANATDKAVTWKSSNHNVAAVSPTGRVTAVNSGTAVITVSSSDGGYSASSTVTVTGGLPSYSLTITNKTGATIYYLYARPAGSSSWGLDLMVSGALINNGSRTVTVRGNSPLFDIQARTSRLTTGINYTVRRVDVTRGILTITTSHRGD